MVKLIAHQCKVMVEIIFMLETSVRVIGKIYDLDQCSWSRRCWSWSWSRSFWCSEFSLDISSRLTLLLHKISFQNSFTNRRKLDSMEWIHPGIHMDCVLVFWYPYKIWVIGPGVYTAALESICTLIVGLNIKQPEYRILRLLSFTFIIRNLAWSRGLDLDLWNIWSWSRRFWSQNWAVEHDLGLDLDLGPSGLGPNTGLIL